ncbi:MAG: acetate--CoA ligase family protein [Candidatus Asgardarchaeia archaeon]
MLEGFFNPTSIAVIGASKTPGKIGFELLKNIVEGGYKGKVYPVNPKEKEILSLKCYKNIKEIPDVIDLTIIIVPAKIVPSVIKDCGEKGVKNVIIISAGFSEVGNIELEKLVKEIAKEYDIRIIGPNCAGLINTWSDLYASFEIRCKKGGISLISQSGAFGGAFITRANYENLGISKFVSYGNAMDINETHFLNFLAEDKTTKVIGIYLETTKNGRELVKNGLKASKEKPVVILKSGRTSAGKRAALSHTGALAGDDRIYTAAFRKSGFIRADSFEDFIDALYVLEEGTIPKNENVFIVTNSGGPGILAVDECERRGLNVPESEDKLKEKLAFLPPICSRKNPIDLVADADYERYYKTLITLAKYPQVGGVIVICVPPVFINPESIAKAVIDAKIEYERNQKSLVACFMSGDVVKKSIEMLKKNKIPVFESPERAARAMEKLILRGKILRRIKN